MSVTFWTPSVHIHVYYYINIVDDVLLSYDSPPKDLVISGVRVIGADALQGADIESVVISEGVVEIRARAFMDCTRLKEVKLPSSLRKIGAWAFSSTRMDMIELPYAVQLGNDVFFDSYLSRVVSDVRIPLYKFPLGCRLVTRAQNRALEKLGADGMYKQREDALRIRIPRHSKEDDMPRISLRQAMKPKAPRAPRAPPPVKRPPVKRPRAKTPPSKPRSGECTICLKPSCEHLNMSRRLGAPIMW
jgi:hypothetical protein